MYRVLALAVSFVDVVLLNNHINIDEMNSYWLFNSPIHLYICVQLKSFDNYSNLFQFFCKHDCSAAVKLSKLIFLLPIISDY